MMSKISSVSLLFASIILISSALNLSPPSNYTWPKNSKSVCFAARFNLTLNVQYLKKDGTQNTVKIALDDKTYESYTVSCTDVHELVISMVSGFTDIIFQFTVDGKNMTSLTKIHGYIVMNDKQTFFPDYALTIEGMHKFFSNESLFTTDRGNSYRCKAKTTVTGFNTNETVVVTSIDLENLRIQPFVDDSKEFTDYGVEKVCTADIDKNSNLIPIIVGVCLAVLVVIVLVAYLIGRRRSRNGYRSV